MEIAFFFLSLQSTNINSFIIFGHEVDKIGDNLFIIINRVLINLL